MSSASIAVLVGAAVTIGTYLAKRIIDYVLPPDRHWPGLDRWTVKDKDEETPDDKP